MKLSTILISVFAQLALATPNAKPDSCNADNCARAVTGTRLGAAHVTIARMDCTSLLAASPTAQTVPSYVANCPNFSRYSSACSCWGATPTTPPVTTPTCPGVNLLTDPNNCGTCGTVCGTGNQCINGVCSVSSCTGAVCGSFQSCGVEGGQCSCFSTSDGTGFCASNQNCANLADCTTTADCGAGFVCVVNSCCTRNICLPAECGNPFNTKKMMARGEDCTAASCPKMSLAGSE